MKKIITLLSVLLACTLSACSTQQPKATNNTAYHASQSRKVLFVVDADNGHVSRYANGYQLTMSLKALRQVLVFTDRPYRITGYVRKSALQHAWYGKTVIQNFAHNPPNAVLSTMNARPAVITITSMHLQGNFVSFRFQPIKPGMFVIPQGLVNKVTLTIDNETIAQYIKAHPNCPDCHKSVSIGTWLRANPGFNPNNDPYSGGSTPSSSTNAVGQIAADDSGEAADAAADVGEDLAIGAAALAGA